MKKLALVLLAAAVLVPVALASSGEPKHAFTPGDQAKARAASLKLSDFVSGWTASPASKDSSNPRCSKYNPDQSDLVETGKYDSPDFTRTADSSFVSVSTGVFKTAAMAKTGYARVAVPAFPGCFGELFAKGVKKPTTAKVLSTGPLDFPRAGDRSNAFRLVASVKAPTATLPVTADIVLFNKGRTDVAMIFFGIGKALPSSLEQSAVARVLSRVH